MELNIQIYAPHATSFTEVPKPKELWREPRVCPLDSGVYVWRYSLPLDGTSQRQWAREVVRWAAERGLQYQIGLRLVESGGGWSNTGSATIWCAVAGSPLRSVGGHYICGGDHAVFYAAEALQITVSRWRGETKGKVTLVRPQLSDDEVTIQTVVVWTWENKEPPGMTPEGVRLGIAWPEAAVKAALEKARCYHCRHPHYSGGEK